MAAGNNADLYEAVFAAHGLRYERQPYAFIAIDPPPPFYAHLTVLRPGHADAVRERTEQLRQRFDDPIGVKDSFCELDATEESVLFSAAWLWRKKAATMPGGWKRIETEEALGTWETAWRGAPSDERQFPETMLNDAAIGFFGSWRDGRIVAGCIANISGDCVGLSNVFPDEAFADAAGCAAAFAPTLPVVGYERGAALDKATASGFEIVGRLRVLAFDTGTKKSGHK
ncbi:hypothetical protein [Martelella endophytica]|uniref:hypothetical protein n=1 Tax=Martelella endophytica TaxID=1486262 RepID=UPI00118671D0|nr:hypothetical protein [Martelella endophytica]